jgi:hypothetical protein
VSHRPSAAYRVYQGQRDHERGLSELDEDLYQLDLVPGLSQVAFDARVREAPGTNPIIEHVRASGQQLRKEDVSSLLEDLTPDDYSADYIWDVLPNALRWNGTSAYAPRPARLTDSLAPAPRSGDGHRERSNCSWMIVASA